MVPTPLVLKKGDSVAIKTTSRRYDHCTKIRRGRHAKVIGFHMKNGKRCVHLAYDTGEKSTMIPENLEAQLELYDPPRSIIKLYSDVESLNTPGLTGIIVDISDAPNGNFGVRWSKTGMTDVVSLIEILVTQVEHLPAATP